jgi:integrase
LKGPKRPAKPYQRSSDGRWVGVFELPHADGKRSRRVVYGASAREVNDKLFRLETELRTTGSLRKASKTTLGQWIDSYLENVAELSVRKSTLARYKGTLTKHVKVHPIAKERLESLTPARIQAHLGILARAEVSPDACDKVWLCLHRALQIAVDQDLLLRNPLDKVIRPKVDRKELVAWSPEECLRFLDAARTDRMYALFLLALSTGMRQGELLGLQKSQINLKTGDLSFSQQLSEVAGKLELTPVKTKKGDRSLVVPQGVLPEIRQHLQRLEAEGLGDCPWLFPSQAGTWTHKANLRNYHFLPTLKRAKVAEITFHGLRHTVASNLLAQGFSPAEVAAQLGHSSAAVTMLFYGKALPGAKTRVAEGLGNILSLQQTKKTRAPKSSKQKS